MSNRKWNPNKKHLFRRRKRSGGGGGDTLRGLVFALVCVCFVVAGGYIALQAGQRASKVDWQSWISPAAYHTPSQEITPEMRKAYKLACEAVREKWGVLDLPVLGNHSLCRESLGKAYSVIIGFNEKIYIVFVHKDKNNFSITHLLRTSCKEAENMSFNQEWLNQLKKR